MSPEDQLVNCRRAKKALSMNVTYDHIRYNHIRIASRLDSVKKLMEKLFDKIIEDSNANLRTANTESPRSTNC